MSHIPGEVNRSKNTIPGEIGYFIDFLGDVAFLGGALAFENDALKFFENGEGFIGMVDFGVALLLTHQEADFFKPLQLALDIAGVFFDQFCQTPDVRLKIWVLSIDHNNLAAHS